jgi:hypothetical protein
MVGVAEHAGGVRRGGGDEAAAGGAGGKNIASGENRHGSVFPHKLSLSERRWTVSKTWQDTIWRVAVCPRGVDFSYHAG